MKIRVDVEVDDDIYCDYCKYLDENTGDRIVLHCNLFHADVYADMGAAYKCPQCLNATRVEEEE